MYYIQDAYTKEYFCGVILGSVLTSKDKRDAVDYSSPKQAARDAKWFTKQTGEDFVVTQ